MVFESSCDAMQLQRSVFTTNLYSSSHTHEPEPSSVRTIPNVQRCTFQVVVNRAIAIKRNSAETSKVDDASKRAS